MDSGVAREQHTDSSNADHDHLLRASLSSTSSLMALQLLSRVFTFILNQALIRMVSPEIFGTAAVQFDLLLSTILFLSREGVRNAVLRTSLTGDRPSVATANLTLLPLILGVPTALISAAVYGQFVEEHTKSQPHFMLAIAVYALAATAELASEPMHARAMSELATNVRVKAEGVAILSRTSVTFFVLLYDSGSPRWNGELALMAFALGQLAYGISLLGAYMRHYGRMTFFLRPIDSPDARGRFSAYFKHEMLNLSLAMTMQSVVKHLLTEGDRFILAWVSPLKDQGGYALAVNYGSLVARIVFQPVEEMCRVYFSKILSSSNTDSLGIMNVESLKQASSALLSLLSLQLSFAVIILIFGFSYLPIILPILLPPRYLSTSAPDVLSAWVWYIPVLSINGGLEGFVASVSTPKDLAQQSRWMALFSVIYICAALIFYRLDAGDAGLVYANIVNLSARIVYSLSFVARYFSSHRGDDHFTWAAVWPRREFLLSVVLSTVLVWYSNNRLHAVRLMKQKGAVAAMSQPVLIHLSLGIVLALACVATWWKFTGRYLVMLKRSKSD